MVVLDGRRRCRVEVAFVVNVLDMAGDADSSPLVNFGSLARLSLRCLTTSSFETTISRDRQFEFLFCRQDEFKIWSWWCYHGIGSGRGL